MIIDPSAVIAIQRNRADSPVVAQAIAEAASRRMSAVNFGRDAGEGSGQPARLNLGDWFAYATAMGAPLLYKGHDFMNVAFGL